MSALLTLEEAQARMLALVSPLPALELPVSDALGRCLAAPLEARRTQPAAALSAMDGYAVIAADQPGPWRVTGESAAGHPFAGTVARGEAVRIATGALLPTGADTVVIQEDCERDGEALRLIDAPTPPGKNVRPPGHDFAAGAVLLERGAPITPARIALALAGGHRTLRVHRRPALAVIDSGDELSADPEQCAPHQIPASNGAMLAALTAPYAGAITRLGPVPDRIEALVAAFQASEGCDVVVTSGGASVGDHDLIRPALAALGAEIAFWKVAIRPGKPLLVARLGSRIVLGLPGNPVSSHVTAQLFLLPLLRALGGAANPLPFGFEAPLASALGPGGARREFIRGQWDGRALRSLTNQDSGALATLAAANVLIDRPPHAPEAGAGTVVRAILLENGGVA